MNTTFERLCTILEREHKLLPERLKLDTPLESLGIDSLGTVELLWSAEDAFQIKLPTQPVELVTLRDVVQFIDELLAHQRSAAAAGAPVVPNLHAL